MFQNLINMGQVGPKLAQIGAMLGQVGAQLGPSRAKMGQMGEQLEPSWSLSRYPFLLFGPSWGKVGPSGAKLGQVGAKLGPSCLQNATQESIQGNLVQKLTRCPNIPNLTILDLS